jgi:RNA polymerase sigma factor (sigma-70 family)
MANAVTREDPGWHRFLELLDPDREAAESAYRSLRDRLVSLFRWRGLAAPDDLADEALERAVRHVAAGEAIHSVAGYVRGVASRLAMEAARREARIEPLADQRAPTDRFDHEVADRLASLERCLDELPPRTRELVLRYYAGGERIADRKRIAEDLGIQLNALRIRIHRVRAALHDCVARSPRHARGSAPPPNVPI